jgi:3',5'-cyclic-AMP phosphodiesterase
VPMVEVACTKDYPGCWAEYRIYEGGYTQVVRRAATDAAMDWADRTRSMFFGLYRDYALGTLEDRCFTYTW